MQISFRNTFYYLLGAIAILAYAIINGYPIIYHDLSTYVANGFDINTPIDRPITYCLFVRVFSLNGITLWTVVLMQSYIVSFLLFKLLSILFPDIPQWKKLFIITVLSLFTGLSWTSSQVMPDIFTAVSVLIVTILFIGDLSRNEKYLMYFLFLLSTAMHLSHISFNIALIGILLFIELLKPKSQRFPFVFKKLLLFFILTAMAFTTMLSASAKSKHVFFMGAMAEHGILQEYLDEYCETEDYVICQYRDNIPKRAFQFVWDKNSPVYKMGSWKGVEDEFNEIIFKTLTSPKYIFLHIKASLIATADQLITFKINDSNGVFLEGTMPYDRMVRYLPGDVNRYKASMQMRNELGFTDWLNVLFSIVVILSLVMIVFFLLQKNVYTGKFATVLYILGIGILLNAWVSGTFANAINRLGCKMIWLIPFIAIVGLIQYLQLKKPVA